MEYVEDFQDCTITQADVNALLCGIKQKASRYRRMEQPETARAIETILTDVSLLVSAVQGRHACKKIVELCREARQQGEPPPQPSKPRPQPSGWSREVPPNPYFDNDGDAELWGQWEDYVNWYSLHSWGKPVQPSQEREGGG